MKALKRLIRLIKHENMYDLDEQYLAWLYQQPACRKVKRHNP